MFDPKLCHIEFNFLCSVRDGYFNLNSVIYDYSIMSSNTSNIEQFFLLYYLYSHKMSIKRRKKKKTI